MPRTSPREPKATNLARARDEATWSSLRRRWTKASELKLSSAEFQALGAWKEALASFSTLDEGPNGRRRSGLLEEGLLPRRDFLEERVSVSADGQPLQLLRFKGDVQPDNKGNMFLNLFFKSPLQALPMEVELDIDFFDVFGKDHKNLAKILMPNKPLQQAVFALGNTRQRFVVRERPDSLWEQFVQRIESWFE